MRAPALFIVCVVTAGAVPVVAQPAADLQSRVRAAIARSEDALKRQHNLDGLAFLKPVMADAVTAGDPLLLARTYELASEAYLGIGDWSAMVDYAQRAIDANPEATDAARCRFESRRARALMEMNDRGAIAAYTSAFELGRRGGDDACVALAQSELAVTYWRLERNRERALALYDESLALSRRINNTARMISILNNSGNLFREPGGYPEAERRYAEGLAIARRLGAEDPFLLKNQGIVFRETGRRDAAEQLLLRAVDAADRQGVGRIRWQARMELGTFYRHTDPDRAAKYFEACIDVLEAQHTNVLLEEYSSGALSGAITIYDDPYDLYIDQLLRYGDTARALLVAERARARSFLDLLASAREALGATVPAAFVRDERELLQRISTEQSRLRLGHVTADGRRHAAESIQRSEQQLTALRVRLATDHPEIAHARYPRVLTVDEIQRSIAPDEAVIEYFLGAEASAMWVIRRDSLSVWRLPAKREIVAKVEPFVQALATPASDYEWRAREVEALVLGRAADGLRDARRLIVVPHGILHYLPFEAIQDERGRFLVERHAVSYAPSIASLSFLRSRPSSTSGGLVAIGNPALGGTDPASDRSAGIDRVALLKPLPHAARELRAVAALFTRADVLEGRDATEPALAGAHLDRAAVVHFATHGIVDERLPQRSGLALTMVPPQSDGLLQVREVYQLRLQAALVTLSACQTALGKDVTGEGVVGLSRAFFYAGARSVMASLWNVNDASTADFMTRFYTALRDGESIDEASRTGKRAFIASGGRLRHPYYWGAFIVSGDAGRPVPMGARRPALALTAAGAGLVAAGVLWARQRRRAARRVAVLAASVDPL